MNFLSEMHPISMTEVGRRMGVNHKDLYQKFPDICRRISFKYKEYLQDFYSVRRANLEEEVRKAVIHLYSQGIYASPRPVAEYLNKPTYLWRRDVAAIIRKTRESLGSIGKAG